MDFSSSLSFGVDRSRVVATGGESRGIGWNPTTDAIQMCSRKSMRCIILNGWDLNYAIEEVVMFAFYDDGL